MKNGNKHLIILITLLVSLFASSLNGFGQTHVYITGNDTGSGSDFPSPPSGTPADNKVKTFKAAIDRANAVGGDVVIHLRTNKLNETAVCAAIKSNVNVQVINDTPARKAIRLKPEAYTSNHRWIGVNGTLTLGGDGCTSVLIIRGQNSDPYYYPTNTDGDDDEEIPPIVLIKANEGTVNIDNNCEVCYGKVNVWISYKTGVVNLKAGAVIHSALDMNVNITQGTFNMSGGYIMGHYKSTGNVVPTYSTAVPDNRILDYDTWIPSKFTKNGTMDYHLDRYEVRDVLEAYYPLQTTTQNGQTVTDPKAKINNAIGVYVHDTKDASGNHLAKFNMTGGAICGIYGGGSHDVIVDASGANFTYYTVNGSNTKMATHPVMVNGGYFKMDGGKIYANHITSSGGGVMILSNDFDATDPDEDFEHAHFYMTDGEISYCSGGTGGGLRIEYGATVEMSGGKITHCVSVPSNSQLNDPDNGIGGGSGGIRMVSSKFVMSNTAEISWCHSPTVSVGQSGGAIGAVWQLGFGYVYTTVELNGGRIHHNKSRGYGGAIAATDKGNTGVVGGISVTINGCEINDNEALIDGGGIYVGGNTTVEIKNSSEIYGNTAGGNGGGVLVRSESSSAPCSLDITSSQIYQNSANKGAGVYVHEGTFNLRSGSYIHDNDATTYGGGVYMDGGEFYHYGGEIGKRYGTNGATANTAQDGAGVYMDGGTYTMSGGYNNGNKATSNGGGVYMNGGTFNLSGGSIGLGSGNYRNTAANGAGVYMANSGTFSMTDGNIQGNYATSNGGGVYMGGGTCSVTGGNIGNSTAYHNEAQYGGGIYSNGGSITIDGGDVKYNVATQSGGGIHCYSGTVHVDSGDITNNSATLNGGGILANGTVYFSDGSINNNTAGTNGGGVSINASGALHVSGTAEMTGNTVTSGNGGGVYQGGTMSVDGSSLKITGNTKSSSANNVYLPVVSGTEKKIAVGNNIVATSVELGIYTQNIANIGQDIPVLTGNNTVLGNIYTALVEGTSKITDDRLMHKPKFPGAATQTLYFTRILFDHGPYDGLTFTNPIDSQEKLYRFMCYVNGVNGFSGTQANAEGIITADIDMTGIQYWMPIGESAAFIGTLTGNGHVISGLNPNLMTHSADDFGLFGVVASGASITDVYMVGTDITKNSTGTLGTLVGKMTGGTVKNCGGAGYLESNNTSCIVGGLVGKMTGGTVHSSFATTEMKGYQMGGLAGDLASGCSIYNSFANAKFTQYSSSSTKYIGGLVGVNKGKVENCYSRVRGTVPSTTYFGWLAGDNTSTTNMGLYYSYAPNSTYVSSSGTQGNKSGLTTFGTTQTPYLYKHADNQMATVSDNTYIENGAMGTVAGTNDVELKGLLATLNNWVTLNSGTTTYTPWMRTSASPINGDYPLHKFSGFDCVASKDNVNIEYGNVFNTKFNEYVTANSGSGTGTIYLYNTPAVLNASTDAQANVSVSNKNKATALYIGEHVALKPQTATDEYDIIATVGISLDNSAGAGGANPTQGGTDAIDWHMFSTSLSDAPLGVNYVKNDLSTTDNTRYAFSWGHPTSPETMPYYRFYAEGNANHGYFPSMEYSWAAAHNFTFDGTNSSPDGNGNWYYDWDYYTYYEPEYHWINFKRNGNSHWHEDYPTVKINYKSNGTGSDWTNESTLIKGRGYLVATVEPTYLQCSGTLTKGSVSVAVTASAWVRTGYNLLGNPYQSYLDFNAFAAANSGEGKIWAAKSSASYYIIDEDNGGYLKYAYNASENEYIAQSYLHPHQGFMVIAENAATATFTEAMRNTTTTENVTFRDGEGTRPAYPLVNLIATEENGNRDVCTVELGRPDKGGAPVLHSLRVSNGLIYCHYDDADWAIAFTRPGVTELPIRFETAEDSEYTLTWDTENGDFHYLHLIDNMTGADVDCLSATEYRFSAKADDYASRFRLVFGYTGIEEPNPEVPEPVEGPTPFAFQMGDELVVNGSGTLEVIDLLGRVVRTERLDGTQSTLGMPDMAKGVYVLRLTTQNGTRTQKIVLQ